MSCGSRLVLAALLVGCAGPTSAPVERPAADAPGGDAGQASGAAVVGGDEEDQLSEARAREITGEIVAEIARARALELTRPLTVVVRDRKQMRAFARDSMYEHHTAAEIDMYGRVDASLGVLEPGDDIESILLDLLEEAVMGIYDPRQRTLLIGAHVSEGLLPMVSGHEIAHGIQDMHFELERLKQPLRGQSDAEAARTYLVEGDAQAAYLAWRAGDYGIESFEDAVLTTMSDQILSLSSALERPILARGLQLPYAAGTATVLRLARERGWAAVDALYGQLPTTSEQMLHLDKLLAREPALEVSIDRAALAAGLGDMKVIWEDNLGEAALLSMLADVAHPALARAAAAGWGGGRYVALDRRAHPAVVPVILGVIACDSEADARALEPVLDRYLQARMPGSFLLERRGPDLRYATRVPDAATRAALEEIGWAPLRVGGRKRR